MGRETPILFGRGGRKMSVCSSRDLAITHLWRLAALGVLGTLFLTLVSKVLGTVIEINNDPVFVEILNIHRRWRDFEYSKSGLNVQNLV